MNIVLSKRTAGKRKHHVKGLFRLLWIVLMLPTEGWAQVDHYLVDAAGGGNISPQVAGRPVLIEVIAKDAAGNPVVTFNGTVDIASTGHLSDGGGTTPPFVNGVLSSYSVTISNTGVFTINATTTGGTETGISKPFAVSYSITATAGPHGNISPAGVLLVDSGASRTFNMIPDAGYDAGEVDVDSVSIGAAASYTFNDIATSHTISVSFTSTASPGSPALELRDDFNRTATLDLSGSPAPLKWVNLSNQGDASASLQINPDSTISPYSLSGTGTFAGVAWDSLLSDTTQIGLIVRHKSGNGSNSSFFMYVRMNNKDLSSGDGYRLRYFDSPSGIDQIMIQMVTGGVNATDLAALNREIAVGDTLVMQVDADKTMKAFVYGADGIRDSIIVVDNTFNPSLWYCWLDGFIYTPPVKMDDFMIGKIPQPIAPKFTVAPPAVSFGTLTVGSVGNDSISVTNTGVLPLVISSAATDNGQFSVSPAGATIAPQAAQKFAVTFAPVTNGSFSGNVIFTHNANGSPAAVAVSGIGTGASIPSVASFTPASGPVSTSVAIHGANFSPVAANDIVFFGATRASVSAATSSTLTAAVPIGATFEPISVETNGFVTGSDRPFVVTFPSDHIIDNSSFDPKTDYAAGQNPHSIIPLDIDGDGKPDLALLNGVDNTISVYRNTASAGPFSAASFAPKIDFPTAGGTYPTYYSIQMAAGDLDGDGLPDLVVANFNGNFISVFRNTSTPGTISFASRIDIPAGINPVCVALGDVDGDGKLDACIANSGGNTVSVFKNTSGGGRITFAPPVNFAARRLPSYIAVSDIDRDGKPDLVATALDGAVSVYRNTVSGGSIGPASFAPAIDFVTGTEPVCVAAADLDGDGKPDLAVANQRSGTVSVYRNTSSPGSISLDPRVDFTVDVIPIHLAIGDIDGDGKPDCAVVNQNSNTVSVLKNLSSAVGMTAGSFAPKVDYLTGAQPRAVGIGDLDGDGKPDLAVANEIGATLSLFRNVVSVAAIFSVTPDSLAVGNVLLGSSRQDSVLVVNLGATPLGISSVVADSSQFSVAPPNAAIPPSAGQKFYITFTPNAIGTVSGHVLFSHDAAGSPASIRVEGTGVVATDTINASTGPHGIISPSGSVVVPFDSSQAFTFTPDSGYHIDSVFVDSIYAGKPVGYTFTHVQARHTIFVKFAPTVFTITASAGPNGTISPSGAVNVAQGGSQAFTFTPNTGYHVDSLIVDGIRLASAPGYTFTNDTSDHTIRVTFAINQFTITASAGPNGTISPSGVVTVNYGANQTFNFTPGTGYHVDSLIVNGVRLASAPGYTFTNDTSNHTIRVTFAISQYTITASAGPNGTISPSGVVNVAEGGSQAFTFTPNSSYHVDSLIVDGIRLASAPGYTFTNDSSNHTIRVTFAINFVVARIKVMLEGPFKNGSMTTILRNNGFLPLSEPYNAPPWNYAGAESVRVMPAGVVDWLFVNLDTGLTGGTRVGARAALLKSDGAVVDTDGSSPVKFTGLPAGNYYIVVKHRNHLGIMSSFAVALTEASSMYDFTSDFSKFYHGGGKTLAPGVFGMFAGDYSEDGFIDGSDFIGPDNDRFRSGYRRSDLNMDGFVDGSDFITPDNNRFKATTVPK